MAVNDLRYFQDKHRSGEVGEAYAGAKRLAEGGNLMAMVQLARWNEAGHPKKSMNYDEAIKWNKAAIEKGDVIEAYISLGRIYMNLRRFDESFSVFDFLVANTEEMGAFYAMGMHYHYGCGVEKNLDKAMWFYQKAVNMGHLLAAGQAAKIYQGSHPIRGTFARLRATWNAIRIIAQNSNDKRVGIF